MSHSWVALRTADGKEYYHNTTTNKTAWDKPLELFNEQDHAIRDLGWSKHSNSGKIYWHHADKQITTWYMGHDAPQTIFLADQNRNTPEEVKQILDQADEGGNVAGPGGNVAGPAGVNAMRNYTSGGAHNNRNDQRRDGRDESRFQDRDRDRERGFQRSHGDGPRSGYSAGMQDPQYATRQDAEEAFFGLLKRTGVKSTWDWATTLDAVVKESAYRAISNPRNRKTMFDKYIKEALATERSEAQERIAKQREDFHKMLRGHQDVKYYSRYKTVLPRIQTETTFRSVDSAEQRKEFFYQFTAGLRQKHEEAQAANHKIAMARLTDLFRDLDINMTTGWRGAQSKVESDADFKGDPVFRSLNKVDVLNAYIGFVRKLEDDAANRKQAEKALKQRRERLDRDRYINLLKELKQNGVIRLTSKWQDVVPSLKEDERFLALLVHDETSSDPVELFWEFTTLSSADRHKLSHQSRVVVDILDRKNIDMGPTVSLDDFRTVISQAQQAHSGEKYSADELEDLYGYLQDKIANAKNDQLAQTDAGDASNRHEGSRRQRQDDMDDLRRHMNKLEPPLVPGMLWPDVRHRLEQYPEFARLSESDRVEAFERTMRRLAEREGGDRSGTHSRSHRGRDGRDRYSDGRERQSDRQERHEPDAYQAERLRAQADREQRFGRPSGGRAGSPSGSARSSDRHYESRRSGGRSSRNFDLDRDSWHRGGPRSRDPRDARDFDFARVDEPPEDVDMELDYGDGGRASSTTGSNGGMSNRRKKGNNDEGDRRDNKRARYTKDASPAKAAAKEEEALKSGSEEGEIEEA